MPRKTGRSINDIIGFKVGVFANVENPDVWTEFDPEDVMELASVQSHGCNRIILTLERRTGRAPLWEDCEEFLDAQVTKCDSNDFLAAIQLLKTIKEKRLSRLRTLSPTVNYLMYNLDDN